MNGSVIEFQLPNTVDRVFKSWTVENASAEEAATELLKVIKKTFVLKWLVTEIMVRDMLWLFELRD